MLDFTDSDNELVEFTKLANSVTKIDMNKINAIIDSVPAISNVDKQLFKESIKIRRELIIDKALKNI